MRAVGLININTKECKNGRIYHVKVVYFEIPKSAMYTLEISTAHDLIGSINYFCEADRDPPTFDVLKIPAIGQKAPLEASEKNEVFFP